MLGAVNRFKEKHQGIVGFTCLFLLIFVVGYYPLWSKGLSLIWDVDGVGQYYPAFIYTGQYLQKFVSGLFSGQMNLPSFDLSIGMGEDIIGSLNYYGFGDPLNLFALFVSRWNVPVLFSFMIVFRMWLSGIALTKYLSYFHFDKAAIMFSGLCYVFSGFSIIGGTMYVQWLSALIFSPMILLGIEKIIHKKKFNFFIFSVCYAALCGFYYLFMISVVLAFYLPIRLLFKRTKLKLLFVKVGQSILAYLIGILLAAPIFFPTLQSYFLSERKSEPIHTILFNLENYLPTFSINVWDYLSRQVLGPPNYLTGIVLLEFLAIIFLLFLPNTKQKIQCLIFLALSFIAYSLPITGYLFNGFGQSNDRWVFILHLIFVGIMAYVLTEYRKILCQKFAFYQGKKQKISLIYFLLGILVSLNIVVNLWGVYADYGYGWSKEFIPYKDAEIYIASPADDSETIQKDAELYRVSNGLLTGINGRPENVAMLNDYYGLTYWFSVINQYTQETVDLHHNGALHWRSFGFQEDPAMNTLSGVKYYLTKEPINAIDGYQQIETLSFNNQDWVVYQNMNFQGLAYVTNETNIPKTNSKEELFREQLPELAKEITGEAEKIAYKGNQFEITTTGTIGEDLVLAVPYYPNWTAYVNGEKIKPEITSINYMTVPLKDGENKITFIYSNPFLFVGFIGVFLAVAAYILCRKLKVFMG